ADLRGRQALPLEPRPRRAAVTRHPDAAPRAARRASPRMEFDLPERREEDARVVRVDDEAREATGRLEPHLRPMFPGVSRLEDAPADRDVRPDERLARADP